MSEIKRLFINIIPKNKTLDNDTGAKSINTISVIRQNQYKVEGIKSKSSIIYKKKMNMGN